MKAARNSAIMCACFLGVIEGVGIGFQRMMAENTRLEVRRNFSSFHDDANVIAGPPATTRPGGAVEDASLIKVDGLSNGLT